MSEQSGTNSSSSGDARSADPASTTTVSDAALEKFARALESNARRWEVVVYPSLFAFAVLATFGFYLIYSMVSDVHRVTEQMITVEHTMMVVSDNMVRVTDNMSSMTANMASITANMSSITANMDTMTNEVVHMSKNFDEAVAIAARMDQKMGVMVPIAHRMQVDADMMNHRMHSVTRPMNFMTSMFPMGN